jgi:hypothetical protein
MDRLIHMALMALLVASLASCSLRRYLPHRSLYHAPALGAEHVLDAGLRPAKKPSTLFSAGMTRYLDQQGVEGKASGKRSSKNQVTAVTRNAAPASRPAPATPAVADSGLHGNFTTPAPSR